MMQEMCLGCKIKEGTHSQGCTSTDLDSECLFRVRHVGEQDWDAAREENTLTCRNL